MNEETEVPMLEVCTECWHDMPDPRTMRWPDDGPFVCPNCGACDPDTEEMSVIEYEKRETLERAKRRLGYIEAAIAKIHEEIWAQLQGSLIDLTDVSDEVIRALELRAEFADLKEALKRLENK